MADEHIIERNEHLDMPTSYMDEIQIRDIDFERQYPNGKTIFYKKAKVELFPSYICSDGLVRRITIYEDDQYTTPIRYCEKYLNRNDYLVESTRDLDTDTITDSFEKGRSDYCKAHRYLAYDKDTIDCERVIDFYYKAHFDGLSRIEMGPFHLTQHYVDRDDFLYYRHTEFSTDKSNSTTNNIHSRHITKIDEKYHRNEKVLAHRDIAVRKFIINKNEIHIKYHYDKGQSTRNTRTFMKPTADRGDRLVFDPSMVHEYHPNPMALPEKNIYLFYDFDKHLKDEDHCTSRIKDTESEVASFLKRRADEKLNLQLTISLFDRDRVVDTAVTKLETEGPRYLSQEDVMRELDPLGPYLARISDLSLITKEGAYLLYDECLNDFKQSSVEKANRILFVMQEHNAKLEKLQASLIQTAELSKAEEEQILAKINELNFDLYVLETYLNHHRESTSRRYQVLVNRLRESPFLQSFGIKL
ncbi:PREDICTED: dynein regulatory complex subunit 7 [Dinoponera quadriceps]|uniref:Dynein regulatory complex subunit 7 n=1 Tax=Dinoponera quadriceps TaxID=609295 RepID=A0A6P3XPX1_DINQU|nr:PREDICTED: dynein regulatory complex subunit 7 [Dinoponera quadriceps]XP_014480247.1 PREDICTED: dynein regulatory complex subunit 7 [Dinoponera quadriceps]XP_014480249.1 PREDICTED: dynein regulatory complex subunit 7 [Dinoponera quadriceps]